MSILNIESKIAEKLNDTEKFQVVYDYHTLETTWYPYASFELDDFDWDVLDSCNDKINTTFWIIVYQELQNQTRREAKTTLYWVLDKLINDFRKDKTLWWVADDMKVMSWQFGTYADWKEWDVMFLEIKIKFDTTLFLND